MPTGAPTRLPTSKIASSPNPEPVVTAQGLRTAETRSLWLHEARDPPAWGAWRSLVSPRSEALFVSRHLPSRTPFLPEGFN